MQNKNHSSRNGKRQSQKREPRKEFRGSLNVQRKAVRRGKRHCAVKERRRRYRIEWKRFLPTVLLLGIFLYGAVNLIAYAIRSTSTQNLNEELQIMYREAMETPIPDSAAPQSTPRETPPPTPTPAAAPEREPQLLDTYQHIGGTVLPEMEKLRSKNSDTVAWLSIPGGIAELPIVYRDNTYYLNHDFYGRRNSGGTLFLDERHPLLPDTQYLVVHGHNMHDGSMFGLLSHYIKPGYMEKYSVVYLSTPYRQEVYEVIGVLYVPVSVHAEGYVPYVGTRKFSDIYHFYSFADSIRENALYWKEGAEMLPSDAFLALSTCYEDYRIVVMCRRI